MLNEFIDILTYILKVNSASAWSNFYVSIIDIASVRTMAILNLQRNLGFRCKFRTWTLLGRFFITLFYFFH